MQLVEYMKDFIVFYWMFYLIGETYESFSEFFSDGK